MDSIVWQADLSWLCAIFLPVPWILEMLLEDILKWDLFCVDQNIAVLFLIYSVVLLYPRIYSILEIFYEFVLDSLEMWLHWTNHTVWTINCFPSKLMEPNKTDSWWDPVILTTGLLSFLIHTLFLRVNQRRRRMIHR
jgi:hypothetical protein